MTGQEFDIIFDRKMREAYTGFYSKTIVKPSFYKEALISYIQQTYKVLNEQQEYDKLRSLIVTNDAYTLTNSELPILSLRQYFHLLAFKATCIDEAFDGTGVKYVSPNRVTTSIQTALRTGEMVTILGTTYYVKQIGSGKNYDLYTDAGLTTAANFGVVANSTLMTRSVSYYGRTLYLSDKKIAQWGKPSIYIPKAEIAEGKIKIYPTATNIIVDYVKEPTVQIIPTDNVVDLELTYPYNFLIGVADKAVEMMAKETHDYQRYNIQAQQNNMESNSTII